jgi:hypothetical protein
VRGIVLRGTSLASMPAQLIKLGAFFTIAMLIAVVRFRKRLD